MTYQEEVAGNVRAEASRRGITKEELADAIGVKRTAIYARWNGERAWTLNELSDIAPIIGVRIYELTATRSDDVLAAA